MDGALNIIYRDTKYNIDFLYTAFVLQEKKIMEDYVIIIRNAEEGIFAEHMQILFTSACQRVGNFIRR